MCLIRKSTTVLATQQSKVERIYFETGIPRGALSERAHQSGQHNRVRVNGFTLKLKFPDVPYQKEHISLGNTT